MQFSKANLYYVSYQKKELLQCMQYKNYKTFYAYETFKYYDAFLK